MVRHIVVLSKTFVAAPAQRQLEWLSRMPELRLTLITPPSWRGDDGGETPFQPVHTRGYRVACLPIVGNGHFHRYAYRGLGRTLSALTPDLVHIDEEPYNPAAWQGLWWARRLGCPAILVAWQNVFRRLPPPYCWGEAWALRHAAALIAGNTGAAAVVRHKGYAGPLATFALHGIDPDLWLPRVAPPPTPEAPFTVGYVGRLVPEKGVDLLIRAHARLPARCRLRIIGRGPGEAALRELARTQGVAERIEWWGALEPAAIPAAMRALDALVLPSRGRPGWQEQFGRVLVEAMASGVPVVGTVSGEIPHVIGDAGLVVPEEDAEALAAALARLAADGELWRHLAYSGRGRALAEHTHMAIARRLAALYATIETVEAYPGYSL